MEPTWFGLGDRDLATHLVRTEMLDAGYPLSEVTQALCERWQPGVDLLPMTDDRVETHIVIDDARRFLERTRDAYDLIAVDPPPPVSAAGSSCRSSSAS